MENTPTGDHFLFVTSLAMEESKFEQDSVITHRLFSEVDLAKALIRKKKIVTPTRVCRSMEVLLNGDHTVLVL